MNIAPRPPAKYEVLASVTGTACGTLGLAGTAYYFIPILLNSRVERAYAAALSAAPGATALINTSLDEYWFWWIVGTTRCTRVQGEAIK